MQFTSFALIAAALSAGVSADFAIVTVSVGSNLLNLANVRLPIPPITVRWLTNPQASYRSSALDAVTSRIGALTQSANAAQASRAVSAHSQLEAFVKTATFKDIPDKVTQLTALETFTTTPAWYSALPSDLKSYYDERTAQAQSVVNQVIGVTQSASASATPSGTAAGNAKPTGAASVDKAVQYAGVGAAALFAGVFAL
jgi:hypothetical protein